MSFLKLQLALDETTGQIAELLNLNTANYRDSFERIKNLFDMIQSGSRPCLLKTQRAPVRATATITFTGLPTAADTFTVNAVTFTARASGASGNEWNYGADATACAAALVVAFNASATAKIVNCVVASSALGVVTFTAVEPGLSGNCFVLTESLGNATRVDFASGTDGTEVILQLGKSSI